MQRVLKGGWPWEEGPCQEVGQACVYWAQLVDGMPLGAPGTGRSQQGGAHKKSSDGEGKARSQATHRHFPRAAEVLGKAGRRGGRLELIVCTLASAPAAQLQEAQITQLSSKWHLLPLCSMTIVSPPVPYA